MKISGRTQPLSKYPIGECLSIIKHLGFDGVEICLENPDLAPDLLTLELVASIRKQVGDFGLHPHSISYHKDFIYDDDMFQQSCRAIRLTPDFGTNIFIISSAWARTKDDAEWNLTVKRTAELVKVAEDAGVILALEPEPGMVISSTADLLRLFDAVPSPHLAANLDLGHVFLTDPDPLQSIRQVGAKIIHCHIENMATGIHNHLLPYEGDMNLAEYLKTLAETGFTGSLALDLYSYDYEEIAEKSILYLRGLVG
ncbi:MAG: sugar phosphate isomerase/epimerase [bacterium]